MQVVVVQSLPETALEASADFVADHLSAIREHLSDGDDLIVVLPMASYDHADWRRAAVRDLARVHAPARINFITAAADDAVEASTRYLASAPGLTGQYLPLHENEPTDG